MLSVWFSPSTFYYQQWLYQNHSAEGLIRPRQKKNNLCFMATDKKAALPPKSVPGNSKKVGPVNII